VHAKIAWSERELKVEPLERVISVRLFWDILMTAPSEGPGLKEERSAHEN